MDGAVAQYTKRTAMGPRRDAVAIAIEQGKSPAPVPAGYRRVDGHLEPGPAKEVSTVRDAFEKRANGATIAEVQAFLAKRGIHRTVSGVRNMLTSKLYIGEVHFGDYTPNLKAHDPIIDRDVFDAVQKMVVTAGRKAKSERLLARLGILKCASCDGRMSASSTSTGYAFYRCSSQACSKPVAIGADIVEREVIAAVVEAAGSRKGCAKLAHQARRAADQADRAQAAYERAQRSPGRLGRRGRSPAHPGREAPGARPGARDRRPASRPRRPRGRHRRRQDPPDRAARRPPRRHPQPRPPGHH